MRTYPPKDQWALYQRPHDYLEPRFRSLRLKHPHLFSRWRIAKDKFITWINQF